MNTKTFNENYEIDRQSKGVKATAKPSGEPFLPETLTADGAALRSESKLLFLRDRHQKHSEIGRLSSRRRLLIGFGLKVVHIGQLRANLDDALADGQQFFNREIERLRDLVREYETKKTPSGRSLKAVLMSG